MRLAALALLACLCSPLQELASQDSVYSFRDLPLGSSEQLMREKHGWGCHDLSQRPELLALFLAHRNCSPLTTGNNSSQYNFGADYGTFAGVRPRYFVVYYWQEKLSLVRVVTNAAFFDQVAQALTDRYGPPLTSASDTVRTRAGVPHVNQLLRWERGGSAISATRIAGTVDESEIRFFLKEWETQSIAYREARRKQNARDW